MRAQARQKKLSIARGELADLSALFQKAQSRQTAAAAEREAALENLRACEIAAAAAAQKRDWTARRNAEIADAIAALQAQDKRLQDALAEAAQAAAAAQVAARKNEDALAQARAGRDEAQARLAAASDAAGKLAQQKAGREIAGRNLRERLAELAARVESLDERRARAQVGEDKLRAELEELSDEAARQNRAQAQAARDEARQKSENAQAAAKESSDALGALEAQRDAALSDAETLRERAGELRLVAREQQIKRRGFADSMEEIGADENALAALANADPPPRAGDLEAEAERLRRSRDKLGAINFAAAEELREAAEKRDFLQAQVKDIEEAAATLTQSIRRIDAEGGARLRDVKVRLDEKLNEMFCAMFAGGEARLAKSGDDEKGEEGGFAIFAQPPGKKVRAIAALSGGEKTLTALAFLFALFSLNPAPFCLLDEADAQLDEANTRRYAALLEKMSAATQFLFITHNKVMLESAQALIGVTQAERGVSRLVSVSVAEALNTIEKNAA
jgi:chromosome segregation protein